VSVLPGYINTEGMTGSAEDVGVIFTDSVAYPGTLVGNATFNSSSRNTGTIIGKATFNTTYYSGSAQTGSTFNITSGALWTGEVRGDSYNSDNTLITNWSFTGTGSNQGTINGDATFTGTAFQIGEVSGTATLSGFAQVVQGISNVVNFFKNLASGRDTIYLTSGSTLNVSGLFTLLGSSADNLLSVRSTDSGVFASLGINGTSNFNFLRLKDIKNLGPSLNLSSKTIFDDGGNTGFTFPTNSTPGSRGGVTRSYTAPQIPVSRGGTSPTDNQTQTSVTTNSGTRSFVPNTINQITLPIQKISPIKFAPIPTFGEDKKGSFSFLVPIKMFLFGTTNDIAIDNLKKYPKLQKYITETLGFSTDQKLVALYKKPIKLDANAGDVLEIFKVVSPKGNPLVTTLRVDKDGRLNQYIKVSEKDNYETLNILLATTSKTAIEGKLSFSVIPAKAGIQSGESKTYTFINEKTKIKTTLKLDEPGLYTFDTPASPIPLIIEVAGQTKSTPNITSDTSKVSLWSRVKGWFGR
jgi:hypothetical protein